MMAGLHLRVGGLRLGLSGAIDATRKGTAAGPLLEEKIVVADVHYLAGALELLAEGALIHQDSAGVATDDLGGYLQLSYGVTEQLRPYARVEHYRHDAAADYLPAPTTTEVLAGVRWELLPALALKLEGAWLRRQKVDGPAARLQLSFLF